MTGERLAQMRAELERIPTRDLVSGPQDCVDFVEALGALRGAATPEGRAGRYPRAA
jgi:hypothetical protein